MAATVDESDESSSEDEEGMERDSAAEQESEHTDDVKDVSDGEEKSAEATKLELVAALQIFCTLAR
eukprot:1565341-Pyramimonas_sp.AAC.1